jgi:hypothetical protein
MDDDEPDDRERTSEYERVRFFFLVTSPSWNHSKGGSSRRGKTSVRCIVLGCLCNLGHMGEFTILSVQISRLNKHDPGEPCRLRFCRSIVGSIDAAAAETIIANAC